MREARRARRRERERALVVAERVRAASLDLRRLSAQHVRHLIMPLVLAGWSAADVSYALDHHPDGSCWPYAGSAKHPAGWARHRLAVWLDADTGVPLPSRSQHLAQAAARRAAEQARVAAERAALRAVAVEAAGSAARARALLASASPRAAEVMRRRAMGQAERSRWLAGRRSQQSDAAPQLEPDHA